MKADSEKVWICFSPRVFFYITDFFINLQITAEWECAFFNTAITIFYLICSLNIPHSNQNPSLVPVERSVSIYSKFILWQHFNISFMMTIVTQKYFLHFFSCNFTIVTGNGNENYIVCLSFPGSQLKLNWESQVY